MTSQVADLAKYRAAKLGSAEVTGCLAAACQAAESEALDSFILLIQTKEGVLEYNYGWLTPPEIKDRLAFIGLLRKLEREVLNDLDADCHE